MKFIDFKVGFDYSKEGNDGRYRVKSIGEGVRDRIIFLYYGNNGRLRGEVPYSKWDIDDGTAVFYQKEEDYELW